MSKSLVRPIVMTSVAPSAKGAAARATAQAKQSKRELCSQLSTTTRRIKHGKEFQFHIHGRVVRICPHKFEIHRDWPNEWRLGGTRQASAASYGAAKPMPVMPIPKGNGLGNK